MDVKERDQAAGSWFILMLITIHMIITTHIMTKVIILLHRDLLKVAQAVPSSANNGVVSAILIVQQVYCRAGNISHL